MERASLVDVEAISGRAGVALRIDAAEWTARATSRLAQGAPRSDNGHDNGGRPSMTDLRKLLFETQARISDREVLATARLNARVKAFAGQELTGDIVARVEAEIFDEADRLIAEGVLTERPDWLAVMVRRRLHVAFGARAVQRLSRELREAGDI
jgi:hypothetical protein